MAAKVEDLAYQPTPYIITQMCIGGIFVMINAYLVIKEISQRLREKPKFKSCGLKWLSMLSVNGGLLLALAWLLHYFDGICLFLFGVYIYVRQTIPICVGLYQLSRLYQCFADNVSGGYPKWLFYVMGIYGILYAVVFTPYKVWNERTVECGLTDKYQYYVRRSGWQFEEWAEWRAIGTSLYLIWDISTLLLFGSKIRSLTNGNPAVGKSATLVLEIRRNMTRIVILTIFYMVMQALDTASYFVIFSQQSQQFNVWYWCINTSFNLISTTAVSYSAFLMQPHNSREYGVFLNLVICLKLHFCCCCYHKDVVSQRDHFLPNMELELVTIHGHNKKNSGTAFNEFSMNDSPSIMIQQQSMRVPPMTLSSVSSTRSQTVEGNDETESAVRPRAETDVRREMLTNDFLFEADSQTKEEFSSGFSFGVYLEYWRRNKNNSVWPKYSTLREELTKNRHSTITEEQFETLLRQCVKLREKHPFSAKDIGTMNIVCGILPGSIMTVDHVICIKLYTDFTVQQAIFKKHCRRLYKGEPIVSVIRRNKEIAHWSRLLRECIMFFGENMTASDVVYCGLNALLIFRSLHQRFECPLSTTMQISVAQHFAGEDGGVILKLKRSNPKTRYLDVSPFTLFKHEDERLFSGSTLKIVDIFIGLQSLKKYINALRMLEQIANGHIIDFGVQTGGLLLSLLRRVVALSVMEVLTECISDHDLGQYLEEEDYDTDAVLDDIEIVDDSNAIMAMGGNSSDILKLIKSTIDGLLDLDTVPKYVWCLFTNFLDEMKMMKEAGTLWINHIELNREEFSEIKAALFEDGKVFDVLSIDKNAIPLVRQFQWNIVGRAYKKLRLLPVSKYIVSPSLVYDVLTGFDRHRITFHFRFYRQYSEEEPQCAIFLEIDEMPDDVKRLRVEIDMKCDKEKRFRQLLRTRVLSKEQRVTGFITFHHREIEANERMEWLFAVKMFNAEVFEVDEEEEFLMELRKSLTGRDGIDWN